MNWKLHEVLDMLDLIGPGGCIEMIGAISRLPLSDSGINGATGVNSLKLQEAAWLYERAKKDPFLSGECKKFAHDFIQHSQIWAGEYLEGVLRDE
jgi:hypothetical protein